jgi:hypothetical protein
LAARNALERVSQLVERHMIKVSNFNKLGDVMYSLPVLKALWRIHGEKISLLLSGAAYQLAPLLWEQPYIGAVELEDTQAHASMPITRGAIFPHWHWYEEGEGLNLSLQPAYFTDEAPISWTDCYRLAAGVPALTESDGVALPSLVNHRRWLSSIDIAVNGIPQEKPKTIIVAPETETLDELMPSVWNGILTQISRAGYRALIVGRRSIPDYYDVENLDAPCDLRGLTSVPTLARMIAESSGFIGAHSFPWHLARHSETPAVCLQTWREGLRRCLPIDTPYTWMEPADAKMAVDTILHANHLTRRAYVDR